MNRTKISLAAFAGVAFGMALMSFLHPKPAKAASRGVNAYIQAEPTDGSAITIYGEQAVGISCTGGSTCYVLSQ
jgi:hypothetical protein